ncbi:hypothetical protein GKG35_12410 [Faecalibacterium sp. BIOML-A3]|uniref:DEAD/DEAH box helicase n=1 Tax=unclassified Faecalibacterium TaxID=2646395 RepID=UPI0012AF68F9|nr:MULTISPECIES: DEAD/DEAH box helicase family protein [unclassified Faecalibacterium]MSD30636.1 hypothetical protein [Faecalibacterium sp. BIOML-A4]MSD48998.1 hypothetical protein [Faecalibacterium sp. BIOML-A3]
MSQYLSEDIKQPIVHSPPGLPRNVYLLKAPTGSGKTTFFIKDLVPEARRRRQQVLLIVNRSVLTEQLINIYLKELGIPPGAIEFPQEGIYPLGDLVVCSYQYMARRLQGKDTPNIKIGPFEAKEYAFVVCDECHYFIADSVFTTDSAPLVNLPKVFAQSVRIYASATMSPVRNVILKMEQVVDLAENFPYWEISPGFRYARNNMISQIYSNYNGLLQRAPFFEVMGAEPDYSYLHPRILADGQSLWDDVIEQYEAHSLRKAVVFVDSKKHGKDCKEKLNSHGISAAFIVSESTSSRSYSMDELDKKVLEEIKTKNRFESVSVLIATSVLDNGTNLIDKDITHLYISGTEYMAAVQQAGRVRMYEEGQTLELVIPRRAKSYFSSRISQWNRQENLLDKWLDADAKTREDMFWNGELEFLRTKFSYNESSHPKNSIFTFASLNYYRSDARDTLRRLEGSPDGYVKKALCWFGFNLSDAVDESLCCQSDAIEQLQTFLEETASKPLNKERWANFRQQFRLLHEAAGGEVLCSGKKDRTPGTQVIEELLPLYGYQVKTSNRLKFIVKEGT